MNPAVLSAVVPQIREKLGDIVVKFAKTIKTAHLDLKEKTAIVMEELDAAAKEIVRQLS